MTTPGGTNFPSESPRPDGGRPLINERPCVVVVGAGFGGLQVIRALSGNETVDVLVLDRNNYHGFWPLLYQVATAALAPDTVAYPLRQITGRSRNVTFQMTEVQRVDLAQHLVHTDAGAIAYDALVLAAGSANNYFGNTSIPKHTLSLKDVDQAVAIRQHLLAMLEQAAHEADAERRRILLTFVIVGVGPTGVELAGAFADLLQPLLRKEYPALALSEVRIMLVEAHETMLRSLNGAIPLGRVAKPEEIAGLVVWLASAQSAYVTATTYFIDGGIMQSSVGL